MDYPGSLSWLVCFGRSSWPTACKLLFVMKGRGWIYNIHTHTYRFHVVGYLSTGLLPEPRMSQADYSRLKRTHLYERLNQRMKIINTTKGKETVTQWSLHMTVIYIRTAVSSGKVHFGVSLIFPLHTLNPLQDSKTKTRTKTTPKPRSKPDWGPLHQNRGYYKSNILRPFLTPVHVSSWVSMTLDARSWQSRGSYGSLLLSIGVFLLLLPD